MINICEMNWAELKWLADYTIKLHQAGYEIKRIYREENGSLAIELKEIVLGEHD